MKTKPPVSRLTALGVCAALCAAALMMTAACSRLKYDITPDAVARYSSATIKVNVKITHPDTGDKKRQSFKILLKFDGNRDKMLFLSPLNQVYGLLFIENERVLLVNTKRKKYWKGHFNTLIEEIWALDFNYSEFKALILTGTIPREKTAARGMRVSIQKEEETGKPERITIGYDNVFLRLKVSNRRTGKGLIDFTPRLKNVSAASIEEALRN